jgi:dipeptidyl aminopeptidase/acylaminoacyl peptidase
MGVGSRLMRSVNNLSSAKTSRRFVIACFFALMGLLAYARAATPRIDRIVKTNILGRAQVEIHFSSDANRTYVLQSIAALPCSTCSNSSSIKWSNLATGFALPYTNHWIFNDTRTNKSRFYRLRVTP